MNSSSGIIALLAGLCAVLCLCSSSFSEPGPWRVSSLQKPDGSVFLEVENNIIRANFVQKHAWKLGEVFYHGKEIVGIYGSNGSVLSVDKESPWERPQQGWLGSGHGGEKLISYEIEADGEVFAYSSDIFLSRKEIKLIKKSEMGPFIYTQTVIFSGAGSHIVQEHSYRVFRDPQGFISMYAFMHCNSKGLDAWLAVLPGSGRMEGLADKGDNSNHLKKEVFSVAFYDENNRKGVSYCFPEAYRGSAWGNFIWDRPRDTKYYFRPYIPSNPEIGVEFSYKIKLTPFTAEPEDWKQTAEKLSEF